MIPVAGSVVNGTTARIHCTTLGGASVTGIDITAVTTKSFIAVDVPGVSKMNHVLQDIGFGSATGRYGKCIPGLKEYIQQVGIGHLIKFLHLVCKINIVIIKGLKHGLYN